MSFIFLLLYLVSTFIRPQDWMIGFYGKPLILIISVITVLSLIFERSLQKGSGLIKVPQNYLIIGLFLAVPLSHLSHLFIWGARHSVTIFYVNVVLFFIILNALNTEKKLKIAIWLIVGLIVLMAIQGIYQSKTGFGWAGQEMTEINQEGKGRINWIGIFNDPNDLALTFVIAIGIVLAFSFGKIKIFLKIICIPLLAVLLFGLYLTNSRGGVLALLSTVSFYFIKRSRKFLLGGIIAAIFIGAILNFAPSRMSLLSAEEESAAARIDMWYSGIQMVKESPFFGRGYGMFTEENPLTTHNSYMLVAAELGLVGLFFFMGLIYASFKELNLIQKTDPVLKPAALGLQSTLVGFCVAAFFLSRSYVILPYLLFALSGSMFHVTQQRNKKLQFIFLKNDILHTGLLSIGILVLIYVAVKIGLK